MQAYLPTTTIGWAGLLSALVLLCLFLWARREGRRGRTMAAAATFRLWGLDDIADLMEAYTIGNYIGRKSVVRVICRLVDRAKNEGIPVMFAKASGKFVDHQLTTEDGRKAIAEKLRVAEQMASLVTPTPAEPTPTQTTTAAE